MSEHTANIIWNRHTQDFTYDSYNRDHEWAFKDIKVPASAAPDFKGNPDHVDPEQAFVAALSSCHMLTFLAIAAKQKFIVDSYEDNAVGYLEKNAQGKLAMTRVILRPHIQFADNKIPSSDELKEMHNKAHHNCFIANSITTDVTIE